MKRREFMAASCLAGLAPLGVAAAEHGGQPKQKELYELRLVQLQSADKQKAFNEFLGKVAIPALNRIGIGPVGVFQFLEEETPNEYILVPHKCLESVAAMAAKLAADERFVADGAEFLEAPKSDPAYLRMESSLMLAFDEIPKLEVPSKKKTRVFQLRTYESHSFERAQKKIDMFNEGGEIAVFRDTGMPPVFFGQTLIGAKMPNLTYMLGFDDIAAKEKGWATFMADPRWNKLKNDPTYKDTVSAITNIMLRPADCSQI